MKHAFLAAWVVLLCLTSASAADRIRIGYSSISGSYLGLWVAHDAGFFAKEGLGGPDDPDPERQPTGPGGDCRGG